VRISELTAEIAEALEADNFAEIVRLGRLHELHPAELLNRCLTAAAAIYADGHEPRRSAGFSALLKLLELFQDERLALSKKTRHRAGLPT
jgi:hypothetical protein